MWKLCRLLGPLCCIGLPILRNYVLLGYSVFVTECYIHWGGGANLVVWHNVQVGGMCLFACQGFLYFVADRLFCICANIIYISRCYKIYWYPLL